MTRTRLGDIVRIDGRLAECIAISPEAPIFQFMGSGGCPTCGRPDQVQIVEGCLNWQNRVEAVPTSKAVA
jgi:hypothetical protein